jgi:hypothetical protein
MFALVRDLPAQDPAYRPARPPPRPLTCGAAFVAPSGPGASKNAASLSLLRDRSPVPAAWSGQAAQCASAGSSEVHSSGKDPSAR